MDLVNFLASTAGRVARALAGLALIALGLVMGGTAGVVVALVGLVPLTAGVFGFCLLGPAFGVSLKHRPPPATH